MSILSLKVKGIGEVAVNEPEAAFCPPEGKKPSKGKTIGDLYANYGGGILDCAAQCGLDPAAALAIMFTEAGCVGAYDDATGLSVIRVEARPPILAQIRFPSGNKQFSAKYGQGQAAEWKALADWCQVDGERAIYYTSFGLAQIMGFNFKLVGLARPLDVLKAAQKSAAEQVEMFFRFVKANQMLGSIKSRDWLSVARKYNGPGQAGFYAGHLSANFERAKKVIGA
jgi:hypothetical protein